MQFLLGAALIIAGGFVFYLCYGYRRLQRQAVIAVSIAQTAGVQPAAAALTGEGEHVQLGISTGLFYDKDILEALPLIRDAGFRHVEIWTGPSKSGEFVHFEWHKPYRVHALAVFLKTLGLKVNSLHAPFAPGIDISHPSELRRTFAVAETLRTLEVLKGLGGDYLVVHPSATENPASERDTRFRQSRKSIEELSRAAAELDLKIAVENQLPHLLGGDPATLLALVDGLPRERVGLCFDTSHANLYPGGAVERSLEMLAPRIVTLHVSDNYGERDDHFILGDGRINWPSVISSLRRARYEGVFMLEIVARAQEQDKNAVLRTSFQRAAELLKTCPA